MIDVEEYELSYLMESYYQEMQEKIALLEEDFLLDDVTTVEILTEGVKETIMQYLTKVTTQITKVYTKFKTTITSKLTEKMQGVITKTINDKMKDDTVSFTVKNVRNYSSNNGESNNLKAALDQLTVQPWSLMEYQQKKDNFASMDAFIKAYYPNVEGKNFKDAILANLPIVAAMPVDKAKLLELLNFFKSTYADIFAEVERDLNTLNNSNREIANNVNTVVTAADNVAQQNEAYMFLESTCLGLFSEADDPKMSFVDNNGEESGKNPAADKAKGEYTKAVATYMSVSSKLLSAKMSVINNAATDYARILMHFYTFYNKNKTGVAPKADTAANQAVMQVPQIKK